MQAWSVGSRWIRAVRDWRSLLAQTFSVSLQKLNLSSMISETIYTTKSGRTGLHSWTSFTWSTVWTSSMRRVRSVSWWTRETTKTCSSFRTPTFTTHSKNASKSSWIIHRPDQHWQSWLHSLNIAIILFFCNTVSVILTFVLTFLARINLKFIDILI